MSLYGTKLTLCSVPLSRPAAKAVWDVSAPFRISLVILFHAIGGQAAGPVCARERSQPSVQVTYAQGHFQTHASRQMARSPPSITSSAAVSIYFTARAPPHGR